MFFLLFEINNSTLNKSAEAVSRKILLPLGAGNNTPLNSLLLAYHYPQIERKEKSDSKQLKSL